MKKLYTVTCIPVTKNQTKLDEKSDVYSVGVLLWEISSGIPPFYEETNNIGLIYEITQGRRETIVPDTPNDYSNLYTECWNGEPTKRPSMHEVVKKLRIFVPYLNSVAIDQQNNITDHIQNEKLTSDRIENSLSGELSRMIQNFHNMNTNEIEYNSNTSSGIDLNIMVNEIVDLIFKECNKGMESIVIKQHVLEYFNNHDINLLEIYNWLLNNQNNSDTIFLFGYFNFYGIGTIRNDENAFTLFISASEQGHILAQLFVGLCYYFGFGITKNIKLAFVYYVKIANIDYAVGQFRVAEGEVVSGISMLGYCYNNGIGTSIDKQKAVELYQKAANLGDEVAQYNLANKYNNGDGIEKDINQAIYCFYGITDKAEGEVVSGISMLGYCYNNGIGTSIDKQKAVELYQKAANLGDELKLYCEINFHKNIVSFYGITDKEKHNEQVKKYLLVMEYTDGRTPKFI
ncbi:hypothetical protein C1645_824310 [Glomus cerebriforme]|uniref:Protein kinase domain-containing protein n=1 Tax=Glomus cerebriforme TaxID=658196 RepID=A0A397SUZ6_9GLOM|nr:hypothetical protein C1645_824310 [Glomus cerebriforme]